MLKGRTVLAAVGATALAGGLSFAAIPANAAPIYSDTSVTADHQSVDAITAITATASLPIPGTVLNHSTVNIAAFNTPATVKFAATGTNLGALTWSITSETNIPASVTISLDAGTGVVTITPPTTGLTVVANPNPITLTVKATDGVASGFETLTAVPQVVNAPFPGCATPGTSCITVLGVTADTDTVTLAGANNNTTGAVDFTSTPVGASLALSNNPPGTALTAGHLAGTTAIPSTEDYPSVSVTATDAAGATAVDTFKLDVYGAISGNDTPRLSHGSAVMLNAVRENVYYTQSGSASCDHFTIVGPGAINGHQGWVPAHLGVNVAVYGGLEAHHGYTVYYQPVSGPADCSTHSTDLWPGAHWGYVYFVS